jgi:hypothetical protein
MTRNEARHRAARGTDDDVARLVLELVTRLRAEQRGDHLCPLCHGCGQVEARREVA